MKVYKDQKEQDQANIKLRLVLKKIKPSFETYGLIKEITCILKCKQLWKKEALLKQVGDKF